MFDLGGPLDRTSILSGKDHVMADKKNVVQLPQPSVAVEFARWLVERAKADGVSLVGPGGLLPGSLGLSWNQRSR